MRTGGLQRTIAIITLSEVMSSGDVTEDASKIEVIRAHVTQKEGTRYLNYDELVDRSVYEITCWDNDYSNNIRILIGSLVLHPIRPLLRKNGRGSMSKEVIIIAATKQNTEGNINDEMTYYQRTDLTAGDNTISTPLTTEPYSVELIDKDGNIVTEGLADVQLVENNGLYDLQIYSSEEMSNVKIKYIF